jgi:hypothetical protein
VTTPRWLAGWLHLNAEWCGGLFTSASRALSLGSLVEPLSSREDCGPHLGWLEVPSFLAVGWISMSLKGHLLKTLWPLEGDTSLQGVSPLGVLSPQSLPQFF